MTSLKIDRCFITNLCGGPRQVALAEAVVKIGATLGLPTVAEGVELPAQAERLRHLACPLGQGNLFARPLPADACQALMTRPGIPAALGAFAPCAFAP